MINEDDKLATDCVNAGRENMLKKIYKYLATTGYTYS